MTQLIETLVRGLVEQPDQVEVTAEDDGPQSKTYRIRVGQGDAGRVIGRGGKVAGALRTVIKHAAQRDGIRAWVEIDT
jgi:uncharacterized protein